MSSIVSNLASIGEKITNVPIAIVNGIGEFLTDIWDAITGLPQLILDGIKDIFIPDTNYVSDAMNEFSNELKQKYYLDTAYFDSLFDGEKVVEDVNVDYSIFGVGTFNFKIFDSTWFVYGVQYFRPVIRGFLVLMMFFYHIKQIVSFFGYDWGGSTGKSDDVSLPSTESRRYYR